MDAIDLLRQQALAKRNAAVQAARREYHAAIKEINALASKLNLKPMFGDCDEDKISTSYIERFNLTVRMSLRRFTRLTNGHSKSLRHHTAMQALFVAWYNFSRKHETPKNTTPAMASGLSDHVWTIKELIERAGGSMKLPRFSLEEIIGSITLVALGAGALTWLWRMPSTGRLSPATEVLCVVLWFACAPLIGAGLFLPFKRPWLGALVGAAMQGWAVQIMFFYYER